MDMQNADAAPKDIIPQKQELSLDKFEFYDIWLLLSIGGNKKGSDLKGIASSGDVLNHSTFILDELNYGMSKLIYNEFVEQRNGRFHWTNKASDFYAANTQESEGCIAQLFRLAPIFQAEPAKPGCELVNYFDTADYEKAYRPNGCLLLIARLLGM